MKTLLLTLFLAATSVDAMVVQAQSNKHKYCEIHKQRDGSYAFYFVPHINTSIRVIGTKSGEMVIWFNNMGGTHLDEKGLKIFDFLKGRIREGVIDPSDRVIAFIVNPTIVDSLHAEYSKLKATDKPIDIHCFETDLLALIEQARKSGTLVDKSK